jgi:hypothetical protein
MVRKKRCAVFTLQKNENFHLPLWIKYYEQYFDHEDMYVVDHDSTESETLATLAIFQEMDGNVRHLKHDLTFDHAWLVNTVHTIQNELLIHYKYVLFTDCDEWVMPANGDLEQFINNATEDVYRCTGYEIIEDDMYRWPLYDKTLLAKVPVTWVYGYHFAQPNVEPDPGLFLYHLHRLDFKEAWKKTQRWKASQVDPVALKNGLAWQNFDIEDLAAFKRWFYNETTREIIPMGPSQSIDKRLTDQFEDLGI